MSPEPAPQANHIPSAVPSVPLADLHSQYLSIREDIDQAMAAVIANSAFVRGPFVEAFEEEFAAAVGNTHCVSCANGTDAIYIALRGLGVCPGDEVITTAHSWIASSETITQAGGRVVFCDTELDSFLIDTDQIEQHITPRTVGIIPVHLFGQPADMEAIMKIARRHGLWVIEDCAQAHLATYKGKPVGTIGNAATFSFYPGKNLGAMGDAGAINTNDTDLARRMAMFARHGGLIKGEHEIEGINSRMDGLQAAILSVKLRHLAGWTRTRQALAAGYDALLRTIPSLSLPAVRCDRSHVYHLYVVRHEDRNGLADYLHRCGIGTRINNPVALPFLKAYDYLCHRPADFPNAYHNQSRILSIPLYPEMTADQQRYVVDRIGDFCSS